MTAVHWFSSIPTLCKWNKPILLSNWRNVTHSVPSRSYDRSNRLRSVQSANLIGCNLVWDVGIFTESESLWSVCACRSEKNMRHFVPNVIISHSGFGAREISQRDLGCTFSAILVRIANFSRVLDVNALCCICSVTILKINRFISGLLEKVNRKQR